VIIDITGTLLLIAAAGAWIGAIVFQSAVVAPTVFVDLDESAARVFLRRLFPRFFKLGLVCGALMLAGLALVGFDAPNALPIAALTVAMLVLEAASLWMVPAINAARDAGEAGKARFDRLHRLSVLFTVVILLLGIGVIALVSAGQPLGPGA
jgi:hypothetical protein